MSYAPILAAAFVLWPVMGLLGAQGYGPLLAVAAVPVLAIARPKTPPAIYALMVLVFVGWAALSDMWSPASRGFVSGNLLEGDFAIRAAGVRIVLTAVFGMLAVAGALQIKQGNAQRSARVMLGAFAVQGLLVALSAVIGGAVVAMIYGADPVEQAKGAQNISRNANAFMIVLPILLAYLVARPGRKWRAVAAGLVVASIVSVIFDDTDSGLIGIVFMLAAAGVVTLAPKTG